MATHAKLPLGSRVSTGHRCPESGVWQAEIAPYGTAPIAKYNVVPPYMGRATTWKLIQYA